MATVVDCPSCNGTGRVPYTGTLDEKTLAICSWYDPDTNTEACGNCKYVMPGKTILNVHGEPCVHDFRHTLLGNCYHGWSCVHCTTGYTVDSGD